MDFGTAIGICFRSYATFSGRASRAEYWYFVLFLVIAYTVATVIDALILEDPRSPFYFITIAVTLLPTIAVFIRRLHDAGRSGWWILLNALPIVGPLILLYFLCSRSVGYGAAKPLTSPEEVACRSDGLRGEKVTKKLTPKGNGLTNNHWAFARIQRVNEMTSTGRNSSRLPVRL